MHLSYTLLLCKGQGEHLLQRKGSIRTVQKAVKAGAVREVRLPITLDWCIIEKSSRKMLCFESVLACFVLPRGRCP